MIKHKKKKKNYIKKKSAFYLNEINKALKKCRMSLNICDNCAIRRNFLLLNKCGNYAIIKKEQMGIERKTERQSLK